MRAVRHFAEASDYSSSVSCEVANVGALTAPVVRWTETRTVTDPALAKVNVIGIDIAG